jgi:hypothetical protein
LEHDLVRDDDDDDEPQQHCLEAMDPPEANSQPTPNDRQIEVDWWSGWPAAAGLWQRS